MGIYSYNKYDAEKGIFQFLQEEGFSPVLMAFGMAPDYLRKEQNLNVLRLGRDMQETQTRELRGILHQAINQSRELAECYAVRWG